LDSKPAAIDIIELLSPTHCMVASPENEKEQPTTTVNDELFFKYFVEGNPVFNDFEHLNDVIDDYEKEAKTRLVIARSEGGVKRQYKCKGHVNCPFVTNFGPHEDGQRIILKTNNRINLMHTVELAKNTAKDGRKIKKRLKGLVQKSVHTVINVKNDPPKPADVVKTASNQLDTNLSYMTAFRGIKTYYKNTTLSATDAFQMVIPYLQKFKTLNDRSTVSWEVDHETHVIQHCFVCPRFMNAAVKYGCPIVSLDACHLKDE
jgi:hypothetical protein